MKALLAMAPVCLVAMIYAMTQGGWDSVGNLVFVETLILVNYRTEKRVLKEQATDDP